LTRRRKAVIFELAEQKEGDRHETTFSGIGAGVGAVRGAPGRSADTPATGDGKGAAQKDAAKAAPKTAAEQDQAFRKRKLDAGKAQEEEAKKQAQARDRAENCKRAKATLANLQLGGRVSRIDEKGERVLLDDQQMVQETAKAREEAAAACN